MKTLKRTSIETESFISYYLEKEKNPAIKYRLAFLNSLKKFDYDLEKACDTFGVALSTAYTWIRRWNQDGYNGIASPFHESDRPRGRPAKLSEEEMARLKQLLSRKQNWLTSEVQKLILDEFGVDYCSTQVARILKKLGAHFSKPYPHDYRRPDDAEEQLMERLEEAFNSLYDKGFSRKDMAIGFVDEASPQTTANTVRFWHLEDAAISKNTTRYKSNTIGFYAIQGNSCIDFMPNSKKESIIKFLKKIREANPEYKKIIVILDNFKSHIARETQEAAQELEIILVTLPVYSPDLNPIEFIWKKIKRTISENFIFSFKYMKRIIFETWEEEKIKTGYAKAWIEQFTPWLLCSDFLR